jgi:hypothetical protein
LPVTPAVVVCCHQDEARGRENRAQDVEAPSGIGRQWIFDPSGQPDDHGDDHDLEDENSPPTDRVFHGDIEVPVVVENAGVEKLVFRV